MGLISICITSYNRVKELIRCLNSIDFDINYCFDIEIIISEDCSPRRNEITKAVNNFKLNTNINVTYNKNEFNLGFDRNIGKLIELAKNDYVLLMSDDDCFEKGTLNVIYEQLKKKHPAYAYTPFKQIDNGELKRDYLYLENINKGINTILKHYDDAILFSGLIFRRELVSKYDASKFLNLNYYQVYLYLEIAYKYNGLYIHIPMINCIGDGENGYGSSDSSTNNPYLVDRESVFSNMEFNKGLIKVIRYFDNIHGTKLIKEYSKEYTLKSFYPMAKARKEGIQCLKIYWRRLNEMDISIGIKANFYYIILLILGYDLCIEIMKFPRKILINKRKNRKI